MFRKIFEKLSAVVGAKQTRRWSGGRIDLQITVIQGNFIGIDCKEKASPFSTTLIICNDDIDLTLL